MDALAAFGGDFDALVALLDPAVVLRSDFGGRRPRRGMVITVRGLMFPIMAFTVANGKIIQIDAIADPDRVRRIAVAVLSDDKGCRASDAEGQRSRYCSLLAPGIRSVASVPWPRSWCSRPGAPVMSNPSLP